jgi:pimeloyl-ACP methyl ester carboxylesterase
MYDTASHDNGGMGGVEQWWAAGERTGVALDGRERAIFVRRMGEGPHVTLVHGFPGSSHDWAKAAALLAPSRTLLMPDLLGFGASEKPIEHTYSVLEDADLLEALWARDGVASTTLVVHDLAVSIGQELLARRSEGSLSVELEAAWFLNGGLYPDLHRPQQAQVAMRDPVQGPLLSMLLNEERLTLALAPTFAPGYDAGEDSADIWEAAHRDDGEKIAHLLISYMGDRETHGKRWVYALETTDVPLSFFWGMLDPISGAHIAERIRERLPDSRLLELPDVSHWPALEVPGQLAEELLRN